MFPKGRERERERERESERERELRSIYNLIVLQRDYRIFVLRNINEKMQVISIIKGRVTKGLQI